MKILDIRENNHFEESKEFILEKLKLTKSFIFAYKEHENGEIILGYHAGEITAFEMMAIGNWLSSVGFKFYDK